MDHIVEGQIRRIKTKIMILDAGHDYGASNKSKTASRSLTDVTSAPALRRFEPVNNAESLIILYSAQRGKEAADGAELQKQPLRGVAGETSC